MGRSITERLFKAQSLGTACSTPRRPGKPLGFETLESRDLLAGSFDGSTPLVQSSVVPPPSRSYDAQLLDIGISPYSIREMTPVGTTLFFVALTPQSGEELWKSDGTSAGTMLVKDISPGPTSASPSSLVNVGGTLFFAADDGIHGAELWKSDGSDAGTVLVKDIVPRFRGSSPASLTEAGGILLFEADDGVHGGELWKSDGSERGTVLVKDINVGPTGSSLDSLTTVSGTVFFSANDGVHGKELWKSDGSGTGTVLVKDIHRGPGDGLPRELTSVGNRLFFAARDGSHGDELWKSDGTSAGTALVRNRAPGSEITLHAGSLRNVDGTLFFVARPGTHGHGLWKSDGTSAGTVLVKIVSVNVLTMANVNGTLYFRARDPLHGTELWKSDGTSAGTILVRDINPGPGDSDPSSFTSFVGAVYFRADNGIHGTELWKTDGTGEGTVLVKDTRPGPFGAEPALLTVVGGKLFFSGIDGARLRLFTTDGTRIESSSQTFDSSLGSWPRTFAGVGDTTFFVASGPHGRRLWKSDGTTAGTALVKPRATFQSTPWYLANVNGTLFFDSRGPLGRELWKSDGTEAGTVLVKDIHPAGDSEPAMLTNVNGTLFFAADDGVHGRELWKSDGTSQGTELVKDITSGSRGTGLSQFTNVNGTLFFVAKDPVHGHELWKSDGTEAGTVIVKDIIPGRIGGFPRNLTNVNGTLFFSVNVRELWKSDGTSAGTVRVKRIAERGAFLSTSAAFPHMDGTVFFAADDANRGTELWKSDGTEAGTVLVKDIFPGSEGSAPSYVRIVGRTLFFEANDGIHGSELWKSDGTSAGTMLAKDINPGPVGSEPAFLTDLAGTVFFVANDGIHGAEIWKSDGSSTGTALVQDIWPGTSSSGPRSLSNTGGTLFFSANDGATGPEPWFIDTVPLVQRSAVNGIGNDNRSLIRSFALQFSVDMTVSSAAALSVFNHTTGQALDMSAARLSNNGSTQVSWDLSEMSLPDGYYTAELSSTAAVNDRGRTLARSHTALFHRLTGDGTGDGRTGFADAALLSNNFGKTVGPYGSGDLDGDGTVGFGDLFVLQNNFNIILTAPQLDFGDAPESGTSFPTTLPNGARHVLGSGLHLGAAVDGESSGQPSASADGDGADEEGVVFPALQAGSFADLSVTATGGVLNAWIDFNADGDWDDIGERVIYERELKSGVNNLTISVPSAAAVGQTYARFRLTSGTGYSYLGLAPDGEVEDYRVSIAAGFASEVLLGTGSYSKRQMPGRDPMHGHVLANKGLLVSPRALVGEQQLLRGKAFAASDRTAWIATSREGVGQEPWYESSPDSNADRALTTADDAAAWRADAGPGRANPLPSHSWRMYLSAVDRVHEDLLDGDRQLVDADLIHVSPEFYFAYESFSTASEH